MLDSAPSAVRSLAIDKRPRVPLGQSGLEHERAQLSLEKGYAASAAREALTWLLSMRLEART